MCQRGRVEGLCDRWERSHLLPEPHRRAAESTQCCMKHPAHVTPPPIEVSEAPTAADVLTPLYRCSDVVDSLKYFHCFFAVRSGFSTYRPFNNRGNNLPSPEAEPYESYRGGQMSLGDVLSRTSDGLHDNLTRSTVVTGGMTTNMSR